MNVKKKNPREIGERIFFFLFIPAIRINATFQSKQLAIVPNKKKRNTFDYNLSQLVQLKFYRSAKLNFDPPYEPMTIFGTFSNKVDTEKGSTLAVKYT